MTVAEVKYRLHVPHGWIAIEFCKVEFQGTDADKLSSAWDAIQYERYDNMKPIIDSLHEQSDEMKKKADDLMTEYEESKPWWRFWDNKSEKAMLRNIGYLRTKIDRMSKTIEEMESKRFYKAYELKSKLHDFLLNNGFLIKNHNTNGSECKTDIEIWEKT